MAIKKIIKSLASLNITIAGLVFLLILVFVGTLAQVDLGIYYAQKTFFKSFIVFWNPFGIPIPILPGGYLIGSILCVNLIAAMVTRIALKKKNIGLIFSHLGLILLIIGGGVSGLLTTESQLSIKEGETKAYSEHLRYIELAVIDKNDPKQDHIISIPEPLLKKKKIIRHPSLPFQIQTKQFFENAQLFFRNKQSNLKGVTLANQGLGKRIFAKSIPVFVKDDLKNNTSFYAEFFDKGISLGTWLLSLDLGSAQEIEINNKTYHLLLRPQRFQTPYKLILKNFTHDVYPGTNTPKNFSSLIYLSDPEKQEFRDTLIYMNHPLRYRGKTYYQASFGNNDTLSILQVVENPGWLLPYISCLLISLGLLIHFVIHLITFSKKRGSS